MPAKRARRGDAEPPVDAIVTEKHIDATDDEQSSDDEAPEEVSAAAATALAGRRRKAEQQARQAAPAPKRSKRARSSASKGGKNASAAAAEGEGAGGSVGGGEMELPSDLLLKVKSGGLQRMEADLLAAREMKEQAEAASATALSAGRRVRKRAGDVARSDNFKLVVLDEDDGGDDGAGSKPVAAENARKFLRERLGSRKRVSYSLLKARKRLGPSPNF